ncbi:hypothetical protein ABMA28_008948 [Loxostege sticticalis]|uniref:Uncharacterized protein n=1 Tax=Loxostege sticticalis TaxID=481309 RepID=A0ABD0SF89_LOXSC
MILIETEIRSRLFFWEDEEWKMRVIIPSMSDDRVIFRIIIKAFGSKYYYKNHTLPKGPLKHFLVNTNWLSHAWEREKAYGLWMWVIQAVKAQKTIFCNVFKLDVVPLK